MSNTDMSDQGLKLNQVYVWAIVLLLAEIAIMLYCAMFMVDKLTGAAAQLQTSKGLERTLRGVDLTQPASTASFILACEQESYSSAISLVRPAVVYIEVEFNNAVKTTAVSPVEGIVFNVAQNGSGRRYGSGVIVDRAGYILTNHHLVANAVNIEVTPFSSNSVKIKGAVVCSDLGEDLALIKVNPGYKMPEATLGDSNKVEVGDVAIAVGSPFGMEHTATLGIISDDSRSVVIDGHLYTSMLQTDAAINTGNSGGALVNTQGEVIGINTAIYAPTGAFAGIGFAIPINRAKELVARNVPIESKAAGGV